jgi:hypothetical protein
MNTLALTRTQPEIVLSHLTQGKSITPVQALLVYGISRLSSAIERLRLSGIDIDMVLREDEVGKKYGVYNLRKSICIGSFVQVKQGHGVGLPYWVRKCAPSKVTGLSGDVAFVRFRHADGEREVTESMNIKELVNVG